MADAKRRGDFNRQRWKWAEAVTRRGELSPISRLLAYVLVSQFAHHETGECRPGLKAMAEAVGATTRTVGRAVAELEAAGFLERGPGGYSGVHVALLFRLDGRALVETTGAQSDRNNTQKEDKNVHQKEDKTVHQKEDKTDHQSGPKRWTDLAGKVDNPDRPPTPPYKAEPNLNQKRVRDGRIAAETIWAPAIRDGRSVPASALNPDQAQHLLRLGLVTEADLRRCGIAW